MTKDNIDLHTLFEDIEELEKFIKKSNSIASLSVFFRKTSENEKCNKNLRILTNFLDAFGDSVDNSLRLFYVFRDLKSPIVCETCGKILPIEQLRKLVRNGFSKRCFCCKKCFDNRIRTEEELKNVSNSVKLRWSKTSKEEKERIYKKQKDTNIIRYGNTCTLNNLEIKKKKLKTLEEHYGKGIISPWQSKEVREKIRKTCIKKYGGPAPLCSEEIKEKSIKSFQKNYNTPLKNPGQLEEVKEKMRQTCIKKYGVSSYSQSKEWKERCIKDVPIDSKKYYSRYKRYKLGNKEILIQGYEGVALDDFIIKNYGIDNIENSISFMKSLEITYEFKGEERTYIPDFYIKNKNLIIEVKSPYTYSCIENAKEMNLKKFSAAINKGYNILILVIDHKRNIQVKSYEDAKIDLKEID